MMVQINPDEYFIFDHTSSGYERVTCRKCGRAFVKQPYMDKVSWFLYYHLFAELHIECKGEGDGTITE